MHAGEVLGLLSLHRGVRLLHRRCCGRSASSRSSRRHGHRWTSAQGREVGGVVARTSWWSGDRLRRKARRCHRGRHRASEGGGGTKGCARATWHGHRRLLLLLLLLRRLRLASAPHFCLDLLHRHRSTSRRRRARRGRALELSLRLRLRLRDPRRPQLCLDFLHRLGCTRGWLLLLLHRRWRWRRSRLCHARQSPEIVKVAGELGVVGSRRWLGCSRCR